MRSAPSVPISVLFGSLLVACASQPATSPAAPAPAPAPSSAPPKARESVDDAAPERPTKAPGYRQVSAGFRLACAIRGDESVVCWGDDELGATSLVPKGRYRSVRAGFDYACAIAADTNALTCWGRRDEWKSVWIAGAAPEGAFDEVYVAEWRACAIRSGSGHLVCWTSEGERPVVTDNEGWARDIPFAKLWIDRDYTCGIRRDNGELACNPVGRPRELPAGPFVDIYNHCARRADGELRCFPIADSDEVPEDAFASLATGSGFYPCGLLRESARPLCWHGATADPRAPDVPLASLSTAWGLSCGVRADTHEVLCWGDDVDEGHIAPTPP